MAKLKKTNPSPFAGLAVFKDKAIISSSPERLIMVKDGYLETRPIAGTRKRGGSGIYDLALSKVMGTIYVVSNSCKIK